MSWNPFLIRKNNEFRLCFVDFVRHHYRCLYTKLVGPFVPTTISLRTRSTISTGGRPHMKKSTTCCWVLTLQFLVAGGEFDCRWSLLLLHFLEPNWGWHRVENTRQEVDEMLLLLFHLLNCSDLLMQPRIFQSNN